MINRLVHFASRRLKDETKLGTSGFGRKRKTRKAGSSSRWDSFVLTRRVGGSIGAAAP